MFRELDLSFLSKCHIFVVLRYDCLYINICVSVCIVTLISQFVNGNLSEFIAVWQNHYYCNINIMLR